MHIKRQAAIFFQFLRRDLYIQSRFFGNYIINYAILFPCTSAIANAYLQANTYFGAGSVQAGTMMFCGTLILLLAVLSFKLSIDLFFDIVGKRFINYQIMLLSPGLLMFERILSCALIVFCVSLPIFPVAKLVLRHNLDLSTTHWPKLVVTFLVISFCVSAYHTCALLIIRSTNQLSTLWARFNNTLISFGGFFIPWYITNQYSSVLGSLNLLNPFLYMSESIRSAVIGGPQFFNWSLSVTMISLFALFFTVCSGILFKRRIDCI